MKEIKLLAQLVRMPTITADTGANEQALDYIETYLKKRGMQCMRHTFDGHGTLMASTRADNHKQHTVLLSAHVDTVPGDESQFELQEKDGKLWGRGVYDMKFAIAGYMRLVDTLSAAGTLAQYDFAIQITTDEEETFGKLSGVGNLLGKGYVPQVVLLPDSTAPGWDIEITSKGWWRFELIATGKAAHSSRPWEGDSASIKLIHALHELKQHFTAQDPLADTFNIGSIHGEGVYNRVPDNMAAKVEIRFAGDDASAKYHELVADLCKRHGLTYKTFYAAEPVHPILDSPFVAAYKASVKQVAGKQPKDFVSLGGSDAPYFTTAGVPCIISCPLGGGHHSQHEWLNKASFLQFVPILRDFLERTAKSPAASVDKHAAYV